jgi:hypothetical protein
MLGGRPTESLARSLVWSRRPTDPELLANYGKNDVGPGT